MIDIEKELTRMSSEFGIPEKEVAVNFRQAVRSMWGDSVFKKDFYEKRCILKVNDNPRSMKRFPKVKRYQCNICKGYFGVADTELDHLISENAMTNLTHAEDFIKNIFFTSPDKLQILCKDKKKKVKGKSEIVRFGCHAILTYQTRYNVSFEEALLSKQIIELCKNKQKGVDFLLSKGVESIPKTHKAQKELIDKLMRT